MKKIVFLVLAVSLGWASCVKESAPKQLTKKEMQQKVDSILAERTRELEAAGQIDLNLRYKIEVKVKADSILTARKNALNNDTSNSKQKLPNTKIAGPGFQDMRIQSQAPQQPNP